MPIDLKEENIYGLYIETKFILTCYYYYTSIMLNFLFIKFQWKKFKE